MSRSKIHTIQLTIRIQNQMGGFTDYNRITLSNVVAAESRFYQIVDSMFKAYPHVTKLKGVVEEISTGKLLDNYEVDRSDWE